MAEFILKDRYGKEKTFDHDKIFVQGTDGELVQFTEGTGDTPAVVQPLKVTENGTYTAPDGVDGFNEVTVNVDPTKITIFKEKEMVGFALDNQLGYIKEEYPPSFTPAVGEKYSVAWDGVVYDNLAVTDASAVVSGAVYIGNGSAYGLPGNNEPFAILYISGVIAYCAFDDSSESHRIGVWKKVVQEINLQDKTITENGTYTADSGYDGLGSVTVEVAGSGASPDLRYVTFMSYDGLMEYGKKAVAVGDDCADPIARGVFSTPTRESNVQYNYTFYGWANEPNGAADPNWNKAITEDKTVYANFVASVRYYTVSLYVDNVLWKTEQVAYGGSVTSTPTKDGYSFASWNPSGDYITENTTLHAVFTAGKLWSWDDLMGQINYSVPSYSQYPTTVKIGDYALLDLGEEGIITMQVAQLHEASSSTSPHIKFIAKELLTTSKAWHSSFVTSFASTELCSYLQNTILPLIPENIRNNMNKLSDSIKVKVPYSLPAELYPDSASKVKCKSGTDVPESYHLSATEGSGYSAKLVYINTGGGKSTTYDNNAVRGVCLEFSL